MQCDIIDPLLVLVTVINLATDTPLTIAARGNLKVRKGCSALLVTLVNGGALLDYRTKEGLTAMHRAVQADNLQAVRTLLGKSYSIIALLTICVATFFICLLRLLLIFHNITSVMIL